MSDLPLFLSSEDLLVSDNLLFEEDLDELSFPDFPNNISCHLVFAFRFSHCGGYTYCAKIESENPPSTDKLYLDLLVFSVI